MDAARIRLIAEACKDSRRVQLRKALDSAELFMAGENYGGAERAMVEGAAAAQRLRELESELRDRLGVEST